MNISNDNSSYYPKYSLYIYINEQRNYSRKTIIEINNIKKGVTMKNIKFLILSFFILLVIFPEITLSGASKGVLLWFNVVLPSILPCMILSNICIKTFGNDFSYPFLYVLFTGLLCGYPIGAKSCVDLYGHHQQKAKKTQFLMALCNNSSPMFILNYVFLQMLGVKFSPAYFVVLYMPLIMLIFVDIFLHKELHFSKNKKTTKTLDSIPSRNFRLEVLDESIINGFEIITKLGGYIIIFSILSEFIQSLSFLPTYLVGILSGCMEITTGIAFICQNTADTNLKIIMVIFCLCFGGFSCLIQTKSILSGTYYSIKKYACHKLLIAIISFITIWLMIRVRIIM